MFGFNGGGDREESTEQGPREPTPAPAGPARSQAIETISAATTNPYASPGVPPLLGEDTTVDFHAAFEVVIEADPGTPIPDPLAQLDAKERAEYREELEDVINAQRYGRSLGSISRHSPR